MGFENQIEIRSSGLQFTTRVIPSEGPPLQKVRKGNQSGTAEIEVDIDSDHLPVDLEIIPVGELAISPLKIRLTDPSQLQSPIPVNLYFSEGTPLNFYVNLLPLNGEQSNVSLEVYGPPFQILDWGQKLLSSRRLIPKGAEDPVETDYGSTLDETLNEACDTLNPEHPAAAITELTDELSRWIPAWEVFYLTDTCTEIVEDYDGHSDKEGLTNFLAQNLINQSDSADYTFETWNEFVQFTDTTHHLSSIPSLKAEEVVKSAFETLLDNKTPRTHPIDMLWEMEQRFDVSIYAIEALGEEETNVLLAKSVIERDYIRSERLISALDAVSVNADLDTLFKKAEKADGEEKLRRARNLLEPALDAGKDKFIEAVILYFDALRPEREYSLPSKAAINEAQVTIYQELDRPNFARTARHYYNYHRGIRFLWVERYQEAANHLKQAVTESLDENATHGDIHFTQLSNSIINYYRAVSKQLNEENRFGEASDRLEQEAIPILQQLDYFRRSENEQEREYTEKQLQAMYRETEGNRYLQQQEYRNAVGEFGQAVALYQATGQEHEAEFLDNRRRAIDAALSEQSGEFEEAADDHETVAESVDERDEFARFHQARATICRSKQDILNWDFKQARQKLSDVDVDWGVAGGEVQHLKLLLDELEAFEDGATSDIRRVLDELDRISIDARGDLHVSYGHDYRPVFIHILAAQRLQRFEEMDEISTSLIKISLSDVLKPDQVDQIMERHGLPDLQLDQQWKERVPIFALDQYHEVEKAESSKISTGNFKDQGDTLTANLEQYLQFIAEYYGCLEYDEEWESRISESSEGPALGPLAKFLNNPAFEELPWIDTVREVLSRVSYDALTMPSKKGDLVDVRNDLHHNNINKLSRQDFEAIKSDIETIYRETALELPVLGKVLGENEYGAYTVHMFKRGTEKSVEITTDEELEQNTIYYFPPQIFTSPDTVPEIESEAIVRCQSHRVRKGLADYGDEEISLKE